MSPRREHNAGSTSPVSGYADPGYAQVRNTFEGLFTREREAGAALSIREGGREVLALHGGWCDAERTRPWRPETLVQTFSVGKPFAAVTACVVLSRAGVDPNDPVCAVWPEYGIEGKQGTTMRQLLSHQAGQPTVPLAAASSDPLDTASIRHALAAAAPEWPPGSAVAEHATTYGHLLDGVVRAVDGRCLADVFDAEVAEPLGLDARFGVVAADLHRVATLEAMVPGWPDAGRDDPAGVARRSLNRSPTFTDTAFLASSRWRRARFPESNLYATATSVARFFAAVAAPDGLVAQLLGPRWHAELVAPQVSGVDLFLGYPVTWTAGFQHEPGQLAMGGLGGSVGWVTLSSGTACAYLTRCLSDHARAAELAEAVSEHA